MKEKEKTCGQPAVQKTRMANMELLRCLAMMMVIVLHFLGKGGLLTTMAPSDRETPFFMGTTATIAWLLEAFAIVSVNVYMMISGYFLCQGSFKLKRLLTLWLQVWCYSVLIGLICAFAGIVGNTNVDTHYFLTLLFPINMEHYWFLTSYIYLYICLPFLSMAIRKMTKKQMQISCVILLCVFCFTKSILPFRMEMDRKGYDFFWYLTVFLVAAYIRKFGLEFLNKKSRGILLYIISCVLIFVSTFIRRGIYLNTGRFELIILKSLEYNYILPFLGALGLFTVFLQIRVPEKISPVICKIAPFTLGVLLLHENIGLRYSWQNWLGADRINHPLELIGYTFFSVLVVFLVGILTDMLRERVMFGLDVLFTRIKPYQQMKAKLRKLDERFSEDE